MSTSSEETVAKRQAPELPNEVGRKAKPGQIVGWIVLVAVILGVLNVLVNNRHIRLEVVWEYLFDPRVLKGLWLTIAMAVLGQIIAMILGVVLAFARLSNNRAASTGALVYIWFFRSVPLLVLILLVGNLALFIEEFSLFGIPGTIISTNDLITPFIAAVLALGLVDAGYLAEIIRSGIISVPNTQREAASALGLSWWATQHKLVLPQAIRVIIPPAGNNFIALLKMTSLAVVIAGGDLLTATNSISAVNYRTIELLFVASIWFMVLVGLATWGQRHLETRFNRHEDAVGLGNVGKSRKKSSAGTKSAPVAGMKGAEL